MSYSKFTFLALLSLFTFISCVKEISPSDVAMNAAINLKEGNYEDFTNSLTTRFTSTEAEDNEAREAILEFMKTKGNRSLQKKGGIREVVLLSETIASDGKSADVFLKIIYGNNDIENNTHCEMVRRHGKWKMIIQK